MTTHIDFYIKKRTLHTILVVLLLLAVSVTVVAAQQQQKLKQSAQQTRQEYPEPPMFGCLQMGKGTNSSCASKLLKTELQVTLRGQDARNQIVFYNDTLEATLIITNVGDLPMKIKKLAVSGHPQNATYKVDFQPAKENFTINPKDTVTLTGSTHKFNNPDPGGPWNIVSGVTDDNGQTVAEVANVNVVVDTTCTAARRVQLTQGQINTLTTKCKATPTADGCADFCEVFGKDKCGGTSTPAGGAKTPVPVAAQSGGSGVCVKSGDPAPAPGARAQCCAGAGLVSFRNGETVCQ